MFKLMLIVPAAVVLSSPLTSSLAQEADSDAWQHVVTEGYRAMSPAQREAVRIAHSEPQAGAATEAAPATKTRAQVRAELMQARASGEFDAIHAEAQVLGPAVAVPPRQLAQRR